MKNLIETGLKAFVVAGLTADVSISPKPPVHVASGTDTIDEGAPYLVCKVVDLVHEGGGLIMAEVLVLVSSPHQRDYETDHNELAGFLRSLFGVAIPPNLPANTGTLSSAISTATAAVYSCRGWHVEGYPDSDADGYKQDGVRLKIGLLNHDVLTCTPFTGTAIVFQ